MFQKKEKALTHRAAGVRQFAPGCTGLLRGQHLHGRIVHGALGHAAALCLVHGRRQHGLVGPALGAHALAEARVVVESAARAAPAVLGLRRTVFQPANAQNALHIAALGLA